MNPNPRLTFQLCLLMFVSGKMAIASDTVDYVKDVRPVFEKHCIACHTADEAQGGLVMESYAALMAGGESGPALTPGVPTSSRLFMMASGKMEPIMPPDDSERPTEDELAVIAMWIEQGANGPEGEIAMRRELQTPQIKTRAGAKTPITSIAISPDGSQYATARYGDLDLVSLVTKQIIRRFESQPGKINSLKFSRDGKKLLVASGTTGLIGTATIYDVRSGNKISVLEGHRDVIQSAIFSPDEKAIATASYDREILLWDIATGKSTQKYVGHNGAIFSIAFSPDGRTLVSGCADETVKVWDVSSGQRLDTMSQPTDEVLTVAVTNDGSFAISGSADNRLRVWSLLSKDAPKINPIVATRFIDESPLTHMALTQDGSRLVVISEAGNVKVLRTSDWNQIALLEPLGETASDMAVSTDGTLILVSLMNGEVVQRPLPNVESNPLEVKPRSVHIKPIYLDVGPLKIMDELVARKEQVIADSTMFDHPIVLARGSEVSGTISSPGEEDWFAFDAHQGEMWIVETQTDGLDSKLDSIIEIRDDQAQSIIQVRLQATRDSYFTFRGKNSTQTDDFRLFAWDEMKLNEFLYASGEVTKLWRYPRGSDSGFDTFPGRGNRWSYFGTTGTVHALGEPAYVVRPLDAGESPAANGLPVFAIYYMNDDDPSQSRKHDSYIAFNSPETARYLIRLFDTRGEGGEKYKYRLKLRPANPSFQASVTEIKNPLRRGSGRELPVNVDRMDGYEGDVWFELDALPPGIHSNFPVRVQPGQSFAIGNIWADADATDWGDAVSPRVTARANIGGRIVERIAGTAGKLTIADRPEAIVQIVVDETTDNGADSNRVQIKRGETISLAVKADRKEGFTKEIPLGNEQAGRNMPHGVYVDNIGLNGLLVRENESDRQFFVTADESAEVGVRDFFLTGAIDGGVTSEPIQLEVIP